MLSECLYLEVFASPDERRLALERFLRYYNGERPHLGIGGRTPAAAASPSSRRASSLTNLARDYT